MIAAPLGSASSSRCVVVCRPAPSSRTSLVRSASRPTSRFTSDVRDDGAGRHTTTHRELLALPNGAAIIDTPGLRELGTVGDGSDAALDRAFADVAALAAVCRFADCAHGSEPGCAVRQAVAEGRLDAARLDAWASLRREQAWLDRRDDPAERARWEAAARQAQRAYRAQVRRRGR